MLCYSYLSMCEYIPVYPFCQWLAFGLLLVLSSMSNAAMKILAVYFCVHVSHCDICQVLKLLVIGYSYDNAE